MIEFLVAAAAGSAGTWLFRKLQVRARKHLPVTVTIDRTRADAAQVAGYLAKIAERLDERPEKMRVVFDAPAGISLDMERDGRLTIRVDGKRARRLDLRHRWIAEHPVPVELKGLVLYLEPVEANRFRVKSEMDFKPPRITALALSLAAALGVILSAPALIGLAAGMGLGLCPPLRFPSPRISPPTGGCRRSAIPRAAARY